MNNIRIGHGYDVHRLVEGRDLIIGGIKIPYDKGLLGHSDADVLVHAVMDSILGALALGDIGKIFPDNDDKFKGADSLDLLSQVIEILEGKNFFISNIDSTIIAQKPKLSKYIDKMRENLARVCKINKEEVSVKATTEEGLGFTGAGEGIAAHAVCICIKGDENEGY